MGVSTALVDRLNFAAKMWLGLGNLLLKGCCHAEWDQLVLLEEQWMRSMEGIQAS